MTKKELEARIVALEDTIKFQDKKIDWLTDAMGSLNNKTTGKSSPHHEFQVGDRVQFKSWEEMEKEFGLTGEDIDCEGTFLFFKEMKHLCNTYATIENIYGDVVGLCDFTSKGDVDWNYSLNMLKPATNEPKCKFNVGDKVLVYQGKKVGIVEFVPTIHDDLYKVGFMDGDCDFFAEEDMTPYTEPRWTFTDDEKVILRNISAEYKWMARDRSGDLFVYENEPEKLVSTWQFTEKYFDNITVFDHLFQSIKWEDETACEFRKYL